MLEIKNLHAGYGQMKVLQGVDLDIQAGEIVALLGSNGAGKSTLNNNISGIYTPTAGSILFEGEDIVGMRSEHVVQKGIIHVPEGRRIFPIFQCVKTLSWAAICAVGKIGRPILTGWWAYFPACKSGFRSWPAPCRAANSKCWRLAVA